jgi:hypothetical protein
MCRDRIDGDVLPLTHRFLSMMLGVRRSGVTDALHILEGRRWTSALLAIRVTTSERNASVAVLLKSLEHR